MSGVNNDDVGRLLRELPRQRASSGFTDRVMNAVSEDVTAPPRWRLPLVAAAAGLLVGTLVVGGSHLVKPRAGAVQVERVEELKNEFLELKGELEKLRSLAAELEPVLELGGTEDVDFVIDLQELADRGPGVYMRPVSDRGPVSSAPPSPQ